MVLSKTVISEFIEALKNDNLLEKIKTGDGVAWGSLKAFLFEKLPENLEDRDNIAYNLVPKAMTKIFAEQNISWYGYRNPNRNNKTYIRSGRNPNQ